MTSKHNVEECCCIDCCLDRGVQKAVRREKNSSSARIERLEAAVEALQDQLSALSDLVNEITGGCP